MGKPGILCDFHLQYFYLKDIRIRKYSRLMFFPFDCFTALKRRNKSKHSSVSDLNEFGLHMHISISSRLYLQ